MMSLNSIWLAFVGASGVVLWVVAIKRIRRTFKYVERAKEWEAAVEAAHARGEMTEEMRDRWMARINKEFSRGVRETLRVDFLSPFKRIWNRFHS